MTTPEPISEPATFVETVQQLAAHIDAVNDGLRLAGLTPTTIAALETNVVVMHTLGTFLGRLSRYEHPDGTPRANPQHTPGGLTFADLHELPNSSVVGFLHGDTAWIKSYTDTAPSLDDWKETGQGRTISSIAVVREGLRSPTALRVLYRPPF